MKRKSPVLLVILILLGMNLNAQTRFRDLIASHDNNDNFTMVIEGLDYEVKFSPIRHKGGSCFISFTVPQKRYPNTKLRGRPTAAFFAGEGYEPHYDGDDRLYFSIKDYNDLTPIIYELFDENELAYLMGHHSSIYIYPIVSKDGDILDLSFSISSYANDLIDVDLEPLLELMKYYKENYKIEDGGFIKMNGEEYDRFSVIIISLQKDGIEYLSSASPYILEPWFDDEFFEQAKESGLDYHIEKYRKELTKEE